MNLPCSDALPMCEEEEGVEQGWVKGSVVWGVKSLPFSRTTRKLRDQHLPRAQLPVIKVGSERLKWEEIGCEKDFC